MSVWSIAGPSIAVFMMATIAGVLIIKIVSDLGTPAVAAVTAGQRINFILVALLMGLGAATTALVSRAWGANDKVLATAYTRLALTVGIALSVIIGALMALFADQVAAFFRLNSEAAPLATEYIRWLSLFAVSQAISMILSTASRAIGDAKTPLYVGIIANSSAVLLAWALAYGKWGLPAMGVFGAAVGSGVAFSFSALIYLLLWMSDRLRLQFSLPADAPRTDFPRFLKVCLPAGIEQLIMQAAMLIFVWFVAQHGTEAFAAYGVGLNLLSLTIVVGLGFSIAASALVGQQLGAGNRQGAIDSGYRALRLAFITMSSLGLLSVMFSREMASMLSNDPEVIELTSHFVFVLGIVHPFLAVDLVLGGAMRGAGDTRFPLMAGIISAVIVRLSLAGIATLMALPVQWIFSIFLADQVVKCIIIWRRYEGRRWLRVLEK